VDIREQEFRDATDLTTALCRWLDSQEVTAKQGLAAMIMLVATVIGKESPTRKDFDAQLRSTTEFLTKYAKIRRAHNI
jgi:hypothetical protein